MTTDLLHWDRRRFLGVAASGLAVAALAGCGLGPSSTPDPADGADGAKGWGGEVVDPGLVKPDVTFTDMHGNPFPFREKTDGKLAMLFFGYTNCPDVCPTTLNALARAIEKIGDGPGSAPMVLFVGVDIARDTPKQLTEYLGRINHTFLGLTGSEHVIATANKQVFNPPIEIGQPDANGEYLVGHSSRVLVYTKDNLAHRIYDGDAVRQQEWVKDLPRLDEGTFK
ncbi:SCO family protein [Aquihabitans sp. McL0605]|uniref:SCO family protein n=1 Tax=Aquihabitans sp. McL0605 TaxID=3415671 RepID=UPI003CF20460